MTVRLRRAAVLLFLAVTLAVPAQAAELTLVVKEAVLADAGWRDAPVIDIRLDAPSTGAFAAFTAEHVGETLGISLGGEHLTSPVLQSAITNGALRLTGSFDKGQAKDVLDRLAAGEILRVTAKP